MKCIIKPTLPVFLSLIAILMLLSGCGDKSENEVLKGKWIPISAVINGERSEERRVGKECASMC